MSLINKKSVGFFVKASVLFLAILFLQIGCVKKQNTERVKSQIVQKTKQAGQGQLLTADLEKKAAELAQLRKETEALLSSLKEKEMNLNKRETQLDSLEADLQAREETLIQKTQNFRNMRSATLIMLFAVLVLLAIAIVLLMKARASGQKKGKDAESDPLAANEEKSVQTDIAMDVKEEPKEARAAVKAGEDAMEQKASDKEEKQKEVKPKRKRVGKSTTTRRKTPSKPKSQAGNENEKDACVDRFASVELLM
ncbi:MAG: hypothetical protein GXO75_19360 [Calditrichaeota bacterium]|nr:hypothetical protein [Calditrichota bacterium]